MVQFGDLEYIFLKITNVEVCQIVDQTKIALILIHPFQQILSKKYHILHVIKFRWRTFIIRG